MPDIIGYSLLFLLLLLLVLVMALTMAASDTAGQLGSVSIMCI